MTSVHGDALAVFSTPVDAAECLCFARDLDASLTHVLVAAAGRAVAAADALAGAAGSAEVGVARLEDGALELVAVPAATRGATLPAVRDGVDAALRDGARTTTRLTVAVVPEGLPVASGALMPDACCVLGSGPCEGDPLTLLLRLHVDRAAVDPIAAEELLARLVRLLAHPYRRLV